MKPIFKDEEIQKTFEQEGYVILPLLEQEEIDDLKAYYESWNIQDGSGRGFHVSMDQLDKDMCKQIREKLWQVIVPKLENHIKDFKPYVGSYVIKDPNPKGVVPAHQDWSFVDKEEEGYCSITCWVALTDSHLENGGMGVIRGSHRIMDNLRPSPSPQTPVPLSEHMFNIFPYLKTLNIKAGEVLFWDNRTFHASPPNTSDETRLAAGVGVTQKDAQLVHYYLKPDGNQDTLLKYNVDEDFFLNYDNSKLSEMYDNGQYIEGYGEPEEVPYTYPHYTTEELVEIIKSAGNEYNVPMTEKLRSIFGDITEEDTKEKDMTEDDEGDETHQEEENGEESQPEENAVEEEPIDDRTFFQKYTPLNIAREIKHKLTKV